MTGFVRWVADTLGYVPREEMETQMAADREMIERLRVASDRAGAMLRSTMESVAEKDRRIAELEGAAATDESSDAEAMRPVVEFLEGLGVSEAEPVPEVQEPGTEPGAPVDGGPVAEPVTEVPGTTEPVASPEGGTVEQPGATTDAPVDPGTGEAQGGPAV